MQAAQYDLSNFDKVLDTNVLDFLTYLQFAKQKGEIEIFEASIK